MNLSTIEQGEELLKHVDTKGWLTMDILDICPDQPPGQSISGHGEEVFSSGGFGHAGCGSSYEAELICFLVNHASELLQMAREVERMKTAIEFCSGSCHNALD